MGHHDEITYDGNHVAHAYEYANAAARTGASGFVAADIGKVARQTDNETFWILTAVTPTWTEATSASGVSGPGSSTDNAIVRFDGTGGYTVQNSITTIDDSGNITLTTGNIVVTAGDVTVTAGDLQMTDGLVIRPEIKDYGVTHNDKGSVSGSVTVDLENGNSQYLTLTGNVTDLILDNPPASGTEGSVKLYIEQGGSGSYTVAWSASETVLWAGASAPTLSIGVGDIDIILLITVDAGTTWFAFVGGLDMS